MGPSHVLHQSINRSIFATILTLWASLVLAPQATAAMPGLTDAQTHPPPTSGPYAYQTFTPNQPDFLDRGESYVDPVFGTTITRVSNVHPDTGSGILHGINGYWNADASLYLQSNVSGVDLINPATGALVEPHVPFTIGGAVSFDPVNADVYYSLAARS